MTRVFVSEATGAAIYAFADDHCPPHVHARHRSDGWIARVRFSYVTDAVELISIAPLRNLPLQRLINRLLDDVQERLADCRRGWWTVTRTTCLANRWAAVTPAGTVTILAARRAAAKQVWDAGYEPHTERLCIIFRDGTRMEWSPSR